MKINLSWNKNLSVEKNLMPYLSALASEIKRWWTSNLTRKKIVPKSTGNKLGFAVFADINRRSIHPHSWNDSKKIAMREIQKKDDVRWVIYTDSLSSMHAIENNRENHPTLN